MTGDVTAYYADLLGRHRDLSDAFCWMVVESCDGPITVESVASRLGCDPAGITEMPWDAAYELEGGGLPVAHLAQAGSAVMVAEVNGFGGSQQSMLTRLSEGGRAHSAYWNINALSSLSCAALGHLLVTFEGLSPDDRHGIDVCALDAELDPLYEALRDPELDFRPAIMAVLERRTGVRLDEEWLAADRPAVVLPYPLGPDRPGHGGSFFDPELESALLLAPPQAADAVVGELTGQLVSAGQLGDEPEVRAALDAFGRGTPRGDACYAPLTELTGRLRQELADEPRSAPVLGSAAWRRMHAAWAIELAFLPPAFIPRPLHSLQHARLALGDDWLAVRSRLRQYVRRPHP